MRTTIFSKGKGWYISASNYKDEKDKCYINLFFPKNTEPFYEDNGRGFSVKTIEIEEGKFTSFNGKAGLTVFKYEECEARTDKQPITDKPKDPVEEIHMTQNYGGGGYDEIKPDDLPFY